MSKYLPSSSNCGRAENKPNLPPNFTTIRQILDREVNSREFFNVIGVVKDHMLPRPTRKDDYKSTITIYDTSTEEDNHAIEVNIFRKVAEMPKVEFGDTVVIFMAKFQIWRGNPSLLDNRMTDIHVYDSKMLPSCKLAKSARGALKEPTRKVSRQPDIKDNEYVWWLSDKVDRSCLPDPSEFSALAERSLNIRDKFTLLKDVKEQHFADVIALVVRTPFDGGDKMTLWIADYTQNNAFFNRVRDGADPMDGAPARDGDPYGYTDKFRRKPEPAKEDNVEWIGPDGKWSMQVTCWEPHAAFIRQNVSLGDWVRLRNVQIKVGHNGMNIEGALRGDPQYTNRINVELLDTSAAERETMDPRLLEALRRKRDHERKEKQLRNTGAKRKAEEHPKQENAKTKREKNREAKRRKYEEEQAEREKQEAAINITALIKCENEDKDLVPLSSILEAVTYQTTVNEEPVTLELPFTNAKYRTQARVVDFHPASLKDFAVSRSSTEYDVLSDNEASDSDSSSSSTPSERPHTRRVWEWRFALKLEEVSASIPKSKKPATTWVLVDNASAQLLTGLDAVGLHLNCNEALLDSLREHMFKLWGNLEERKTQIEAKRKLHARRPLNAPPVDSSDVEDNNTVTLDAPAGDDGRVPGLSQLSNRPFTCCIQQYGIRLKDERGQTEDEGPGWRWQRVFGLFGTKIVSD